MTTVQTVQPEPVKVSDEATRALAQMMREWSGWDNARLVFGKPTASPFAECDHVHRTFTANPERLVLNPHRVLLTITPFRMRQEAVLTGALLHEASHARHSHWQPRSAEQRAALVHHDGASVTKQTLALAKLMEEPRIEGIMASQADHVGALGLGWTMRAAAAHLVPTTRLHIDADQKVMDLIQSWALRAGRQISLAHRTGYHTPNWVGDFTNLLHNTLLAHLESLGGIGAHTTVGTVMSKVVGMVTAGTEADRGTFMLDEARDILDILFPETDGDNDSAPMPESGCIEQAEPEDQPEDQPQPEDEQGADESGDQPEEGDEGTDEAETPADEGSGDEEADAEEGEGEGEGDEESDEVSEDPDTGSGQGDGEPEGDESEEGEQPDTESDLAQALREMEDRAKSEVEDETDDAANEQPPLGGGIAGGDDGEGDEGKGFRDPTAAEREVQKGAERFLRGLISPSESSKVVLTEAPCATVDPAAMTAWKAGGQQRDPVFFKRTKREVQPTPPVKIAILVDVSGSMDELQKPSALLSWALASAAIDLRNFAGRGAQVESCLIHWGSHARVVQRNGQMLPGIREVPCMEGTSAMHEAYGLVEEELPGFFDLPERPENRLLVHFTDWELAGWTRRAAAEGTMKALAAGVNMLTVAPRDYSERRSDLADILSGCHVQRGSSTVMRYNKMFPEQVWDEASRVLA